MMELLPRLGLGTICIAPFMEGFIYYQSTCPEFRYGDGKVLGTQPHPTHGSASTQCVLRLNLIKDIFNIVILNSHTHTSIHLAINMAFSFQTLKKIINGIATNINQGQNIMADPNKHVIQTET